jgi:hypothetical protein
MDATTVLQAAQSAPAPSPSKPVVLIAGAGGPLGNEVLRRLAGMQNYRHVVVLTQEPMSPALAGIRMVQVPAHAACAAWPLQVADVGVILFDPPRPYNERERALWTPTPDQLPALAAWMLASGVRTLAIVLPHDQGRLPEALKRGLANLNEHAVATMGFERLLLVRTAAQPARPKHTHLLDQLAHRMLSIFAYMVPSAEQPPRALRVAELVEVALRHLPPGVHVMPPELARKASEHSVAETVRAWLKT